MGEELATKPRLLLIAGHYEGFDQRISSLLQPMELSIGDYVLSGGELAAMVVVDAVVRLLPGVLGAADGTAAESFAGGLLEYPQFTRPREYRGQSVPPVLLSGDHAAIAAWRQELSERRTREVRPDLWAKWQAENQPVPRPKQKRDRCGFKALGRANLWGEWNAGWGLALGVAIGGGR